MSQQVCVNIVATALVLAVAALIIGWLGDELGLETVTVFAGILVWICMFSMIFSITMRFVSAIWGIA